ncbi:MAG: SAM-dependent methyltransferase [Rhodobacteraceae bacterium]|nr:SAM-dependent methyltransferase [Paracoccaceae bacterium]MAY46704.1 SAM-dependent methyltransferase [Paracoccaceae bacterium]
MQDRWTDGEAYERYVGRWSRLTGKGFLDWLDTAPGQRWLDLGCGSGALSAQILARCDPRAVTGVEPSEAFRATAEAAIDDPRARFLAGSGEAIPLEDASVDVAVSGLVLNFIPDKPRALAELKRCVTPGGTIAAYVWDYAGHAQFIRFFWDAACALDPAARALDEGPRFPLCHPGALEALFAGEGLKDVRTAPIDIVTPFTDFDEYWTPFLSGIGPAPGYCAALDAPARDRLRARLAEILPTDPDGRILLAARAWAVCGQR